MSAPAPAVQREGAPTAAAPRPPAPHHGLPEADGVAFVRPYVVAHEERVRREQRRRRRSLWLAVHGIDIGPRRIHGVEVAR
ncbi:hypothetical protein [Streptomyces sp. SAJ15]|uniref:hypothetical protein n=1 Tax=Streptomyces sp. SAJ15 TaxID=2011095 RepID=UPI0028CB9C27|nr:hypothetical protein [Streptomyces sp. SAJ15]